MPLPGSLIQALVGHPELFPDDIHILLTQEQELILEVAPGSLEGGVQLGDFG